MKRDLTASLREWLGERERRRMGQVLILRRKGGYELRHEQDGDRDDLRDSTDPEEARSLATYDEQGEFRPLKTAPTLQRGWRLRLATVEEVRVALDYFYPAMLGMMRDWQGGQVVAVPLRETLGRQTGMYAVTRKITDPQALETIAACCNLETGCRKTILWQIAENVPISSVSAEKIAVPPKGPGERAEIPLLCHEACNMLVAKARETVKRDASSTSPPQHA